MSLMHHPKIITSSIQSQHTFVNFKNLFFVFSNVRHNGVWILQQFLSDKHIF